MQTESQCCPRSPVHRVDQVQDQVRDLLTDGVMASGVVVGYIFLPSDHLLQVEELPPLLSIQQHAPDSFCF